MKKLLWIISTITCLWAGPHSQASAQTTTIIASGDIWKYLAIGAAPASANWKGGGPFDDSAWPSGPSQLGYGNDGEVTLIPFGPDPSNKYITTYFRKTITLSDASGTFQIDYMRDDGIVLYINGQEVTREYMPAGPVSYSTLSTGIPESEEPLWKTITVPANVLKVGTNVIAAEIHQVSPTSSDIRFNLKLYKTSSLVRGPYLQMGTPTAMTLRWRTGQANLGRVQYWTTAPNSLTAKVDETNSTTEHEVRLTGLTPNQTYYYAIGSTDGSVWQSDPDNVFVTAPLAGASKKTRIWALGDFGNGSDRQKKVNQAFQTYMGNTYIDMWLWLGDNAYGWGLDEQYQDNVFGVYGSQRIMKQTPIYATPGNHDYRNNGEDPSDPNTRKHHKIAYYDIVNNFKAGEGGGVASGKEEYYSFNYGNIHVISLDSYGYEECIRNADNTYTCPYSILDPNAPQMKWLERDLAAAQTDPKITWIIVITHYPPYSMGTKDSDVDPELINIRQRLVPVLEKYSKVDLLLTGHSHVYERSYLMKKGHYGLEATFDHKAPDANNGSSSGRFDGTPNSCYYHKSTADPNSYLVYVVNGSGGAWASNGVYPKWPHNAMQASHDIGGSMLLEIDGNRLDAKFITENGEVKDQFTIFKDTEAFGIPKTDGTTRTASCECTDVSGYTHYTDKDANLLLSVKKDGQSIGRVGDGYFDLRLQGAAGATKIPAGNGANYVTAPAGWSVMNRFWSLKPTQEPVNPVLVRHYYQSADLQAINSRLSAALSHQQLKVFKINSDGSTSYNPNPALGHTGIPKATAYNTNGAWIYNNGNGASTSIWTYSALINGHHYAEYQVAKLSSGGGIGGPSPFGTTTQPACATMIASGDFWKYLAIGAAPASEAWKGGSAYDDLCWSEGPSQLGYGDDGEKTVVPYGPDPNNKFITTYFRKTLNLADVTGTFTLDYQRDDGIVLYINGIEVKREYMPAGPVSYTTLSTGMPESEEPLWKTFTVPANVLKAGTNVIAAEIHQVSPTSSDIRFDLRLQTCTSTTTMTSTAVSSTSTTMPGGNRDLITGTTGQSVQEAINVLVYPNPVQNGKIYFTPALTYQSYIMTNLQGRICKEGTQPGTLYGMDVSDLPVGVYILVSQDADGKTSQFKIVKQ
ncbi:hypothetical protein GCM10023187_31480 [Nibrella viscosa]|uniref:Por secretion system C-terminal sorting domain-containing protein n=1 Tax=Nibrella viscosa TaxID=1084524 RepID=A0ABP8KJW9_9BACT